MAMRMMLAALTALIVVGSAERASAVQYPWCAELRDPGGMSTNCGFTSYAQCMATVRGIGGFCRENSFNRVWTTDSEPVRPRKRARPY
jgi:hypothetical protein